VNPWFLQRIVSLPHLGNFVLFLASHSVIVHLLADTSSLVTRKSKAGPNIQNQEGPKSQ
jgi:hypothetical protein